MCFEFYAYLITFDGSTYLFLRTENEWKIGSHQLKGNCTTLSEMQKKKLCLGYFQTINRTSETLKKTMNK